MSFFTHRLNMLLPLVRHAWGRNRTLIQDNLDSGARFGRKKRATRRVVLTLEGLERRDLLSTAMLTVTSSLDPALLTPGTLRYAVEKANVDATQGISDTILFNTTQMGTSTISLQQGQLL
jgi:hypothetical protein